MRRRHRGLLVAGEIALCFVLLSGTGLLLRTFVAHQQIDPGFAPERVTTAYTHLPWREFPEREDRGALLREMTEKVTAVVGVESVGLTSSIPFDAAGGHRPIALESDPESELLVWDALVAPGYFRTMGIPLLAGRYPEWSDFTDPDRPFAWVDQGLAERLWPGEDAVGRLVRVSRLRFGEDGDLPNEYAWAEVLGVVARVHDDTLTARGPETFYLGMSFIPTMTPILTIKTADEPAAVVPEVREALRQIHEEVATSAFTDMDDRIAGSTANLRFVMSLLGVFGAIGLALAAVGLYALLSYSVRRGLGEIGLRVALGAERWNILRLVFAQGLKLTLIGLGLGMVASAGLNRLLTGLLFGVSAGDPGTSAAVAMVLAGACVVACGVPALRALAIDPLTALRTD